MLPAYDQYKNTGYQWLPEIPENWQMLRGKNLFEDVDVRSKTGEGELLTVSHITGVTPRKQKTNVTMFQADSLEGYKLCEPGDFVANTMWVWMGAIAVSKYEGLVSPAYNVYRQIGTNYNPDYLDYLLRVYPLVAEYKRHSRGVRSSRLRLYPEQLLRIGFPLPPLDEQNQIVRYLDSKISRIHHLISLKKREIVLLQEMKQAVISHAVTKGLDPNAEMKDSGVEWIGEIPKEWSVKKIKYLYQVVNGATPKSDRSEYWGGEIHWITPAEMGGGIIYISSSQRSITNIGLKSCSTTLVPTNSLIISTRAPIGYVCIAGVELCTNQGCKSLVNISGIVSKYSYYYMISQKLILERLGNGTTFSELSNHDLENFSHTYPPLSEQNAIASYLDQKCNQINNLINTCEVSIKYLQEYRTHLISDVVTGKIDVWNITVSDPLPEENLIIEEHEDETDLWDDEI